MAPTNCDCLKIAGTLRDCPAHGEFATASARLAYEQEIELLRARISEMEAAA